MGRKDTLAAKSIRKMYEQLNLNQSDIFSKTKLLLSVYRDVVWITLSESARVNEELVYYGEELDSALVYLELFAPDTEKQEFESRISALFENKWMVDLIDTAMAKIYDYHNNGRLYHEIISKSYLTAFRYTESELLDGLVELLSVVKGIKQRFNPGLEIEGILFTMDSSRYNNSKRNKQAVKMAYGKEIQYLLECLHDNTTKIHNVRAYLLACIFNAPSTINNYYRAEVNHDMYGGGNL